MSSAQDRRSAGLAPTVGGPAVRARTWLAAHPMVLDAGIALLLEVWVFTSLRFNSERDWWQIPLSQALVLPLVARRRYPWLVFWVLVVVGGIQWLSDVRFVADVALLVALYGVAAYEPRRRAWLGAAVLEVGVVLASVRFTPTGDGFLASMIFLTGMVAAALFGGITLQTRRQYLAALVDRAARLEHERDQQRSLAAQEERTRIARELHDVVAHSLSVIITLADAAALANASEPTQATEAMRQVATTGRDSIMEMRRLLGVLREDGSAPLVPFAPQPALARLDALVADVRAAGLPARLSVSGVPRELPLTAQSAAYRIVQESLTNIIKHADDPSMVHIQIQWRPDEMQIVVTDDGRLPAARQVSDTAREHASAAGHGVIGMRERAALFNGTVDAGPLPTCGWKVQAILPVGSAG